MANISLYRPLPGGESVWIRTDVGIHTDLNTGIGTTNPTSKLTVRGNALITGIVTAANFAGDGSLLTGITAQGTGVQVRDDGTIVGTASVINFASNLDVTFASGIASITVPNIRTGNNILFSGNNQTAPSINVGVATDNFIAGAGAARYLTTGLSNVIIGKNAGYDTDIGSYNTFLNRDAGRSNTFGDYNTFIGRESGYFNTSGIHNVAIGNSSGRSNTIGSFNNFVGRLSGFNNTEGANNVFLGDLSGFNNVLGNNNISIGSSSGFNNTFGNLNISIGRRSAFSNTTGSGNIIVGDNSGSNLTTGNCNTVIGYDSISTQTTGSNNIAIGSTVRLPITNGSNQLAIGVNNNLWISGNSSFNVGVGTTNPTARLDVSGSVRANSIDVFGIIKASRINTASEGGQVELARSTDNSTAWYVDVFGSTATPSFRIVDATASSARMTIDSSGNTLITGITTVGLANTSTPASNSQMSFELTSDTNLRIKVRGADGVLRSVDLTLA